MRFLPAFLLLAFSSVSFGMDNAPTGSAASMFIKVHPNDFTSYYYCYNAIPYINFTSTVSVDSSNIIVQRPFYPTWTPDDFGTRPYQVLSIQNSSTTQSVSFYITTTEPVPRSIYQYTDSKLWYGDYDKYHAPIWWQPVDDDHGYNRNFGAKITLAPTQAITLIISTFSANTAQPSERPWFSVVIVNSDNLLDSGYPELIVNSSGNINCINCNTY